MYAAVRGEPEENDLSDPDDANPRTPDSVSPKTWANSPGAQPPAILVSHPSADRVVPVVNVMAKRLSSPDVCADASEALVSEPPVAQEHKSAAPLPPRSVSFPEPTETSTDDMTLPVSPDCIELEGSDDDGEPVEVERPEVTPKPAEDGLAPAEDGSAPAELRDGMEEELKPPARLAKHAVSSSLDSLTPAVDGAAMSDSDELLSDDSFSRSDTRGGDEFI